MNGILTGIRQVLGRTFVRSIIVLGGYLIVLHITKKYSSVVPDEMTGVVVGLYIAACFGALWWAARPLLQFLEQKQKELHAQLEKQK